MENTIILDAIAFRSNVKEKALDIHKDITKHKLFNEKCPVSEMYYQTLLRTYKMLNDFIHEVEKNG